MTMPTEPLPVLSINLCHRAIHFLIDKLLIYLDPIALGRQLYERLQLPCPLSDTNLLEIYLPDKLLSIRFDLLHDGYQYTALRTPINLILSDTPQETPSALIRRPLRILLTYGMGKAEASDDRVISQLADHANKLVSSEDRRAVETTILREPSLRELLAVIKKAQVDRTPFHIWHHVGECRSTDEGPVISLWNGDLKPTELRKVIELLQPFTDAGCRLIVLHTPEIGYPLLPLLGQLPVPCAIGLTMGNASDTLLRGLYMRLLTHDVINAVFAARLDRYIEKYDDNSWSALQMLCRTRPFRLVANSWNDPVSCSPSEKNEIPRLLFLRANPLNAQQGQLPIDHEIQEIKRVLEWREGEFDMHDEGALAPDQLLRYLLKRRPNLLHFSGHGSNRGSLLFETADSAKVFVRPEQIAPMIAEFPTVQCVVLNACYSEALADLLANHGKVVIGTSQAISNVAAASFSFGFYQALTFGESVASAFKLALRQIGMSKASDEIHIFQIRNAERAAELYFFKQDDFKRRLS